MTGRRRVRELMRRAGRKVEKRLASQNPRRRSGCG
jgi:hypothetical protein